MEPADTYKGSIIQSQKVFYVEVWDSDHDTATSLVRTARAQRRKLWNRPKKWIDKYQSKFPEECQSTYPILSEI